AVLGNDAFQETPIIEVYRGITKHHYLVTRTEDITRVVKEAFHIATTGRPGPIIIDICKDVQTRKIVPEWDPPMDLPGYQPMRRGGGGGHRRGGRGGGNSTRSSRRSSPVRSRSSTPAAASRIAARRTS